MGRHTSVPRHALRAASLLTGALVLVGCTTVPRALAAVGLPSLSLDAPLTTVACTTGGTCVALGASGGANAPSTTAQIRNEKGLWSALRAPAALLATFDTGSCASTRCYFGGTKSSGELLWAINANNGAINSLAGPPGGVVIRNVSCVNDNECAVLDVAAHDALRLSYTTNAGTTWSAPRTLRWASVADTALSCLAVTDCFVASSSARHVVTLRQTLNGGARFISVPTPPTWQSLTSLQCAPQCTALVTTASASAVATQVSTTWHQSPLSFHAAALSCATTSACLVVGQRSNATPDMVQWTPHGVRPVALTYVPSNLTDVACRPSVCVAIGITTVVALQP